MQTTYTIYMDLVACRLSMYMHDLQLYTVFADVACRSHQYQCTNGRCIYRDWMCDGVEDCPLGDDELPSLCSKSFAKISKKLNVDLIVTI